VRDVIVKEVEGVLDRAAPSLLKEYLASVLHPMERDLRRVVQQAMKDAFRVEGVACRFENDVDHDSQILSLQQHGQILSWLPESSEHKQVKLELLYRASRDGWQGQDFQSRCDNKGTTVTVIKCTGGFVFGGYAEVSWNSSGSYTHSAQAFLFSLHSPSGMGPLKLPVKNNQYAMHGDASCGPTFGAGHDLHVGNCANSNTSSYTNLGGTYQLPPGQSAQSFFTGSHTFQAAEVEVYQVILSDRQDRVSVHVPLESFDQVFECVPDVRASLLRALNTDKNYFDTQVEVLRGLFSGDKQEPLQWPSAEADKMLKNPPLMLAELFPSVIDSIIDEMRADLKPKADALIREAVSGIVQRFSDEVARVEGWRKTLVADGVVLELVTAERMSELCEELVLSFLRYNSAMLQRREIIARQRALEQADDGVFELIGVHTPAEKEEWMLSI
jgi:hypothetical protein